MEDADGAAQLAVLKGGRFSQQFVTVASYTSLCELR
jgi:hypothetical protein